MSIFKTLQPQKIVDAVFSGVDKSILTKEELLDIAVKASVLNLEFVKATQKESTPRSITRRIIAIMILGQYFLSFNVGLFGLASKLYDGKLIIELSTTAFATLSLTVVIFYFGNHIVTPIINKFSNKKVDVK